MSDSWSEAADWAMIGPRSLLYTTRQTTPDEAKIQADTKMSNVAQKSGLKRAQILQPLLSSNG